MDDHKNPISYYCLDGLDKKGPYTIDELIVRNVTPDTLIYTEGMASWIAVREVPELSARIFERPTVADEEQPPLPEISSNDNVDSTTFDLVPNNEAKIRIPSTLFLLIGICIALALSYYIDLNQKEHDLNYIQSEINNVLNGKDEVCDYQEQGVQGQLKAPDILSPNDNDGNRLVEYYTCTNGGFTVLTLTKKENGYEIVTTTSGDMGYKVPASHYTPGKDYGYGISTPGFYTSTYRQSVQTAYNEAMAYLSSEKENKSYNPGSYDKIKSFDEISSPFYYIDNIDPTKISASATNFKSWKGNGPASVYNGEWMVYYSTEGKHYEIVERHNTFIIRLLIYSLIGCCLAILLYLIVIHRRKIAIS
jgi:hypothetical protein